MVRSSFRLLKWTHLVKLNDKSIFLQRVLSEALALGGILLQQKDLCKIETIAKIPRPVAPPGRACLPHRQARSLY